MSSQDNYIHELNMACLMNKHQYEKYINSKETVILNKKDQKFYRKRILAITKDLLYETDQSGNNIHSDIKYEFYNYIKTCIQYFKCQDKSDILQEDYLDILDKSVNVDDPGEYDPMETNKVMMRSIQFKDTGLEKFVKHVTNTPLKEPILPKKRRVNLKDPSLKEKGIHKNKNININYDKKEVNKTETTQKENT